MARYPGDQNTTGFYYESGTYGSASGTLQWLGDVTNFEATDDPKIKPIHYHGTATRNVDLMVQTGKAFAGTVTFYPTDWKSVLFALGSSLDTSGATSTHAIAELNGGSQAANVSGTENPFYSFQLYNSQNVPGTGTKANRQYAGVVCSEWTLTVPQGDLLTVDMAWVAQDMTFSSGTTASITAATARPFISADTKWHLPSGTVVTLMNTASLNINNNVETKQYANGSLVIGVPIVGQRDYTFDTGIDSSSEWYKILVEQYLMGASQFNSLLSVDVSSSRKASFIMSGCNFTAKGESVGLEGVNQMSLTFKPTSLIVQVSDTIPKYNAW